MTLLLSTTLIPNSCRSDADRLKTTIDGNEVEIINLDDFPELIFTFKIPKELDTDPYDTIYNIVGM